MYPNFKSDFLFSLTSFNYITDIENSNSLLPNSNNFLLDINDHIVLDNYLNRLYTIEQTLSSSSMNSDNNSSLTSKTNTIFGYPMTIDIFSAFYAATITVGGLIGYLKAGSVPSLVTGLIFGNLLVLGTYLTSVNSDDCYFTLGTSTILSGIMGFRFYRTNKFMPAGLVCALSLSMVTRCIYQILKSEKLKKIN